MQCISRASKNPRQFTLVEMLVVVAIITIIAAMLMPALQNAVHVARDAACANQQRQASLACISYSGDYAGYLPYNDLTGAHLYTNVNNYILGSRTINSHHVGLGLLYKYSYCTTGRVLWCANEDEPKLQNASENKYNGYKRLESSTSPSESVGSDYWYRCGWWNKQNNAFERVAKISSPKDGMIMCGGSGSSGRINWERLHQGRGFSLCFIDGSSQWYAYAAHLPPNLWGGNNYRGTDYPKQTLEYASTTIRE